MSIKKIIFLILGFLGLILGAIGAFIPLLPSFPFLLLAAFGFAKSSERLHTWFISTKLYKKNLESFVQGKGMTIPAKIRVLSIITLVMAIGFTIMMIKGIYIPSIILGVVWIFHVIYFIFGIKTIKNSIEMTTETNFS